MSRKWELLKRNGASKSLPGHLHSYSCPALDTFLPFLGCLPLPSLHWVLPIQILRPQCVSLCSSSVAFWKPLHLNYLILFSIELFSNDSADHLIAVLRKNKCQIGSNQFIHYYVLFLPLFLLGMCKAHLQREGSDKSCSEITTKETLLKFAQASVSSTSIPSCRGTAFPSCRIQFGKQCLGYRLQRTRPLGVSSFGWGGLAHVRPHGGKSVLGLEWDWATHHSPRGHECEVPRLFIPEPFWGWGMSFQGRAGGY